MKGGCPPLNSGFELGQAPYQPRYTHAFTSKVHIVAIYNTTLKSVFSRKMGSMGEIPF
jgi:hypothetical protein